MKKRILTIAVLSALSTLAQADDISFAPGAGLGSTLDMYQVVGTTNDGIDTVTLSSGTLSQINVMTGSEVGGANTLTIDQSAASDSIANVALNAGLTAGNGSYVDTLNDVGAGAYAPADSTANGHIADITAAVDGVKGQVTTDATTGNTVTLTQSGTTDVAAIAVAGGTNTVELSQSGIGNISNILVDGSNNTVSVAQINDYAVYNVRPDDGGNRLCETVQFDPSNSWGGEDSKGNDACIDIPYNYTLTPAVGVDHEYIDTNVDFNVTPRVTNAGPTFSQRSDWKLTQIVMAAGNNLSNTSGGNSFSSPCDYFDPSHISSSCQPALSGNNNTVFDLSGNAVSGDALSTYVGNTGSSAIGTKICYVMSVKSRSSSLSAGEDTRWAHSASRCLIISKNPKVQILSSDLLTRGLVKTSTTDKNVGGIRRFGSWTEYGVLAPGLILGMASGSAYAGSGLVDSALCNYSKLSFANVRLGGAGCENDPVTIGNYNNLSSIPNVAVSFSSSGMAVFDEVVANNLPKNSPDSVTDIYHAVGDLILDASTLSAGRSIVIKVSGTVTITGDQEYNDGPYNRISQIPQLVIIANKIVINSNVTKVNAWLVAHNDAKTGEIYTCQIVGDTASKCKDKLIVNGPVMTDKLYLYRTAGSESGDASGEPAEVFNLRSDAYLWALLQAKNGNHIRTVYTTELPPRY